MRTLFYNAWILTMDSQYHEYKDGMLIMEDDHIVYVGEAIVCSDCERKIDVHGHLLMPGMINTHCHVSMIPFRSLGDDCKDRLRRYLFPLENACMSESMVYLAAKYGILEMLSAGITTFVDMYYFMDKVAIACEELGIRGLLGETIINQATCDSDEPYGGLAIGEDFIQTWQDSPLITPILAPHATNTNDPEIFEEAMDIVKKQGTMMTTHVAEMDYEMTYFQENYKQTPVEWLDSLGVLNEHLLAVHCIHVNEHDMDLMAKRGVSVAHCIGSNIKAGKGIAPVKEMMDRGIKVGFGSDGASSSNTLDMFVQMRLFAGTQKTKYQDRSLFPAREVVRIATIGGAQAIHMDHAIGSLEVGKKADITIVETDSINMFPIHDPYSVLVYSANASNVEHVFVNGEHLIDHKRCKLDIRGLQSELQEEMQEFNEIAKERQAMLLES